MPRPKPEPGEAMSYTDILRSADIPLKDDVRTTVVLPAGLHQALVARAAQEDRSLAATMRRAFYHYLKCDKWAEL